MDIQNEKQIKKLAERLSADLKSNTCIALYGDLGAGKTTFTRYLVEALGFTDRVQSPTFVVHRIYKKTSTNNGISKIHHLDLYRITNSVDIEELGLHEIFEDKEAICLIEWPQIIEAELPKGTIKIYFEYIGENERKITIHNKN